MKRDRAGVAGSGVKQRARGPIYYRVHLGDDMPSPGTLLAPSTDFFEGMDEKRKTVEQVFEAKRLAEKPRREGVTYLFKKRSDAVDHFCRHTDAHLLEAEVKSEDVLHEADWGWLDAAVTDHNNQDWVEKCAKGYWNGESVETARVTEVLARNVKVVREVTVTKEERDQMASRKFGATFDDIVEGEGHGFFRRPATEPSAKPRTTNENGGAG